MWCRAWRKLTQQGRRKGIKGDTAFMEDLLDAVDHFIRSPLMNVRPKRSVLWVMAAARRERKA